VGIVAKPGRGTTRQREAGAASRAETRRLLLIAAGELFGERGYAGSTVTAIAGRAGVSLQTLYLAWGSKRQLLRAFMEQGLSGSPTAVTDDTWADMARTRLLADLPGDPDPQTYVRAMARFFRATAERAVLGWQLYRDAAAVDPEVRADQQELSRLRRFTAVGLLSGLPTSALRAGMTRDDAVDTVMVVMGPESYDLLVRQTGYSLDRFERCSADTLIAALLEPVHE
jgi:AcrR family transcriptional regulator